MGTHSRPNLQPTNQPSNQPILQATNPPTLQACSPSSPSLASPSPQLPLATTTTRWEGEDTRGLPLPQPLPPRTLPSLPLPHPNSQPCLQQLKQPGWSTLLPALDPSQCLRRPTKPLPRFPRTP